MKTRRDEQVAHVLATRERQVERALRIEALLAPIEHDPDYGECAEGKGLRTHHGWGACVKVRDCDCTCAGDLVEPHACTCGYWLAREIFWDDVATIASEYDFAIHSEGRSGGYAVVNASSMPSLDDIWPSERTEFFRERLAPFVLDVEDYLTNARSLFKAGKLVTGELVADAILR